MSTRAPSIRPLYDHVVVRRLESTTKTAGGIVIPDSASEKPNRGEVLAVGPGKLLDNGTLRELSVKPGDQILFGKYAPNELKVDGEDVLILKESDILGILENTHDNDTKLEKAA
jgi:chaperonin GroES